MPGSFRGWVRRQALRYGKKPAVIDPVAQRALSYEALETVSCGIAQYLRERGVGPGDRVALAFPNSAAAVTWFLGAMSLGAVPFLLDLRMKAAEVRILLSDCAASLLVIESAGLVSWNPADIPCRILILSGLELDPLRFFSDFPDGDASSPAFIWPTSGTTGLPKGVLLSHAALLARCRSYTRLLGLDDSAVTLCLLPISFGIVFPCLYTLHLGGTLLLCPVFSLKSLPLVWAWVARYRVGVLFVVPSIVRQLVQFRADSKGKDLTSLRFVLCASSPLEPRWIDSFEAAYGVPLLNCYGIKEAGFISVTSPDLSRRAVESAGEICQGEVKIAAPDGSSLPIGEMGEVLFRGPSLYMGYCKGPEADTEALRDGWFHTGDQGSLDEKGRLYLRGRTSEIIIRNGLKVSPQEVEAVLLRHAAILDAAAVGLTDPAVGERVAACVVLREGTKAREAALIRHCRNYLADYKCPARVLAVPVIPRTSLGKIERAALRAYFQER